MAKEIKTSRMELARREERNKIESLFQKEIPVWYSPDGRVMPEWLSVCKEERNLTRNLMESIATPLNLSKALKKVLENAGSAGVDGMSTKELKGWYRKNYQNLQQELLSGSYQPEPVRSVQIPKPKGGYRQLGIPTAKDRLVQQAIQQVLSVHYDGTFSETSYGFRPNRSCHQAINQAGEYIKQGYRIVIDLDLEKFFDEVNHHRLLWLLETRISDKRVIKLIHRFMKTGILIGGMVEQRAKGTPQGSPLSPLLSNIVLDELDKELDRRGHKYVRYADDVKIFVKSQESAQRAKDKITKHIEKKLKLKVNQEKSGICKGYELSFLGHGFLNDGSPILSRESEQRLKSKIRAITRRNRGEALSEIIEQLKRSLQGWLIYFRYAKMQSKMKAIDGWMRRKLKCFRLKQCKRTIAIVRWLRSLKVGEQLSWKTALSGKGWWRLSNSPALNIGMSNQWFIEQGYYSLLDNYKTLHRKLQ